MGENIADQEAVKTLLAQMKLVERVVRPLRAGTARKRKMREELLAHLQAIYTEERARPNEPETAMREAAKRFGDPDELSREIQVSMPASERWAYWFERWFGWRAPESAERYMFRQAGHSLLIISAIICAPAIAMIHDGMMDAGAWRMLRTLTAAVLLTPALQFTLWVLYFKMRDALYGPYWSHKSLGKALLLDLSIALTVFGGGIGFAIIVSWNLSDAKNYALFFSVVGVLMAIAYYFQARSRGRIEIADTYWACLKLENAE